MAPVFKSKSQPRQLPYPGLSVLSLTFHPQYFLFLTDAALDSNPGPMMSESPSQGLAAAAAPGDGRVRSAIQMRATRDFQCYARANTVKPAGAGGGGGFCYL